MTIEYLPLEEVTDIGEDRKLVRYKRARFKVDGREHTLRISMKDFDEGKTKALVDAEIAKITFSSSKKS